MRYSLLILGLVLTLPASALAQGRLVPMCPIPADGPRAVSACGAQVVRTSSDVQARLDGRVLHYTVTEQFTNRGARLGEADYLFPLPAGAAFRNLKLSIDGRMVAGETMDATSARAVYEEIVRKLRDPALVEWMGAGLLRARIFPIQAGETRTVSVEFDAVAPREGDALRVDYKRGEVASSWHDERFVLTYPRGDAFGRAYSPANRMAERDSAGMRVVTVTGQAPNVTILVPLHVGNRAGITVLTHARAGARDGGFAMITVTPPAIRGTPSARDVTFVVDVSGSMSGRKMEQARLAGEALLRTLRPGDRFRLVSFANDVNEFQADYVYATPANLRRGLQFLKLLDAGGGTNIGGALEAALEPQRAGREDDRADRPQRLTRAPGDRLSLVLFLTDGMPTVGETNADRIAELAERERGRARIFTFGLGSDVNSALLERLAMDGRGTSQFVRPEEDVERMVGVVAERLTDPVATDLRVTVNGHDVALRDVVPQAPMDLFGGQDLVVLARYTGSGEARVTVTGRSQGRDVQWTSTARFDDEARENAFIPRLWAAQRIGYLSAERRRNGPNPEVDDEIRALGERYGIPTEFTSYLVTEPRYAAGATRDQSATGVVGSPAAASAVVSKAEANFEAARLASAQRRVMNTAMLDSLSVAARGAGASSVQLVNGHTFTLRDSVWTDAAYHDSTRTVTVQAFSRSYFALLQRIPELRAMAALGDHVRIGGRQVNVEIVSRAPELTDAELDLVTRGW
ncbi:MAG TPA: VIT domain-containing protein [Gemmatimonadaceae bacterium]|nr:VIT domain-containing protein [Gemmatimonadaceae bacterium]